MRHSHEFNVKQFLCDDEAKIKGEIEGEDVYDEESCSSIQGYFRVVMLSD